MRIVQLLTQPDGGPADHAPTSRMRSPVAATTATCRAPLPGHRPGPLRRGHLARAAHRPRRPTCAVAATSSAAAGARAGPGAPAGPPGRVIGRVWRPRCGRTGIVYTLHGVADGLSDLVPATSGPHPDAVETLATTWPASGHSPGSAGAGSSYPARRSRVRVDHVGLPPGRSSTSSTTESTRRFRGPRAVTARCPVWVGALAPVKRLDVLLGGRPGRRASGCASSATVPCATGRTPVAGSDLDRPGDAAWDTATRPGSCPRGHASTRSRPPPRTARWPCSRRWPPGSRSSPAVGGVPEVVRDGSTGCSSRGRRGRARRRARPARG